MKIKKIFTTFFACLFVVCIFGCNNETTNESSSSPKSNYEEPLTWNMAGDGCGSYIPEPSLEYDWKAWSSYLCVDVLNATENDFYDYVDLCLAHGFEGEVDEAETPSLYLMAYNEENYYLEIFYYADNQHFTIYIRKP